MPGSRQTANGVVQTAGGVAQTVPSSGGGGGGESILDSFEDQDLAEYSGDTGGFSIKNESNLSFSARDGSYVLENPGDISNGIYSSSITAAKGTTINGWVRGTADSLASYCFGVGTDTGDCYQARVDINNDDILLYDQGDGTILAADYSPGVSADTWYRIEVVWDDGSLGGSDNDITMRVFDDSGTQQGDTLSANDSTHANEDGIGVIVNGGSSWTAWLDYIYEGSDTGSTSLTTIDSFEDGDISEWSGDTGDYQVVQSPSGAIAEGGNYTLERLNPGAYPGIEVLSTSSALGTGYARGDVLRWYFYSPSSNTRYIFRFGSTNTDKYSVRTYYGTSDLSPDTLKLFKDNTELASTTFSQSLATDTRYFMRVEYDVSGNGDITAQVREDDGPWESNTISANDTEHSNDVLMIRADDLASGETAYIDHIIKED